MNEQKRTTGYAPVSGLKMDYEIHGSRPICLATAWAAASRCRSPSADRWQRVGRDDVIVGCASAVLVGIAVVSVDACRAAVPFDVFRP
jgi:hypothetical protein